MDYIKSSLYLDKRLGRDPELPVTKSMVLQDIITFRFMVQRLMVKIQDSKFEYRTRERDIKKLQEKGITMPILDIKLKFEKGRREIYEGLSVSLGGLLMNSLDLWQQMGATLEELCNLCNREYLWARKIDLELAGKQFSDIIFVYYLDYKDNKYDFIVDTPDSPFTYAIREFMLDKMLHDPSGKRAAHEALVGCFPELWENAMFMNEDGTMLPIN